MFDQCLYFNATSLARKLEREWAVAFKSFELTPAQAFMLRVVLQKKNALQHEIAAEMNITKSTATRTLDGLERLNYVVRVSSKEDRRECEIHPTEKAQAIEAALNESSRAMTTRFKSILGADLFEHLVENIRAVSNRI